MVRLITQPAPAVQPVQSSVHAAHAQVLAAFPVVPVFRAATCTPACGRFSVGPRSTRPRVTDGRASPTFTLEVFFKIKTQR